MLKKLVVKNMAIIEDLTINFDSKMTVLTGETGAGKSLIIDTISLLLGARTDVDMIRYQEHMLMVMGVFDMNDELIDIFKKYDIPVFDDITILREIYDNSRNIIKINNKGINLTILKIIGNHLADIHVQNDTYRLFDPENYLLLLDPKDDPKFADIFSDYTKALYDYLEEIKNYEHVLNGQKNAIKQLDFLKYESEELTSLNLEDNIDEVLEEQIAKLVNFDKIHNGLTEAYNLLENEAPILDNIYEASKALKSIQGYDKMFASYSEKLMDCYYQIDEIKTDVYHQVSNLDYDEEELNFLTSRLNEINKAKDKYKMSVFELIDHLKKINMEIEMATNYDELLKTIQNECKIKYDKITLASQALTAYRKDLAKQLEFAIENECKELDLEDISFKIEFNNPNYNDYLDKSIFLPSGVDVINFMISLNKGEPLKPLHKVASGGEMSRLMLAFKSYFSKKHNVSLMVFDEIDTGVSGATAKKIAVKMHQIAADTQVLCITHLPQVAAIGDHHKHIYKILDGERTITQIKDLDYNGRVEEIAFMLSGDKLSLYALEHAKSLLKQ